jgi:hypothetical protein
MSKNCERNLVIAVTVVTVFTLAVMRTMKDVDRAVREMIRL